MSAEGFDLDVEYTDASGNEHRFLLDVNCSNMKWKLYDARLNFIMAGKHGPPGINAVGGITGTAFWFDDGKTTCFVLRDFLSTPFYASKYPKGSNGAGAFVNKPSAYQLNNNDLKWIVG